MALWHGQVGCGPDGCQSPAADENLMLVTANGLITRTKLLDVKVYGLPAKGLRLLKLSEGGHGPERDPPQGYCRGAPWQRSHLVINRLLR